MVQGIKNTPSRSPFQTGRIGGDEHEGNRPGIPPLRSLGFMILVCSTGMSFIADKADISSWLIFILAVHLSQAIFVLTGFNHLTLAVRSLPRSIAFYGETLGFKLSARWKTGRYLSQGDLWLCLSSDSARAEDMQRNYTHYAFSIDQKNFVESSQRLPPSYRLKH